MVNEARYMPPEIMEKILSRLPVKSLLRFKSVCMSWNALISSHPFIRTHLQHYSSQSHTLFIEKCSLLDAKYNRLLRFQDGQFHVDLPTGGNRHLTRCCSCDGILLLEDRPGDLLLWNPSMRKITKLVLPKFSKTFPTGPFRSIRDDCPEYGLCYDPATVDLKVVVFYGLQRYSVYSCKNKCWSKEHGVAGYDEKYSVYGTDSVSVDGALYWILRGHGLGTSACGDLLCFESEGDKFKTVQRPVELEKREKFCLISLRGRLCVWSRCDGESLVRIWMRGEDEVWRDFMRIFDKIPRPYSHYNWLEPLYVDVEENEIIRVCLDSNIRRRIAVYHPRGKTYQEFDLPRNEEDEDSDSDAEEIVYNRLFSSVDTLLQPIN